MVNLTTSTDVPNKIPNLFKCQQYFMDNSTPDYILFPNAKDEYNSNSYAKGLLNAAGINDLGGPEMFEVLVLGSNPYVTNTAIPGYEYPVPKKYFGLS